MRTELVFSVNWLHVLVAALAYFAIGSVWYSGMFGKKWVALHQLDLNSPDAKKGIASIMTSSFVMMFITCVGLELLLRWMGVQQAVSGLQVGLLTGICFSAMAISISYVYVRKPLGLHFIDGLYHIVGQVAAAIILSVWA